jgi:hypothetical protein
MGSAPSFLGHAPARTLRFENLFLSASAKSRSTTTATRVEQKHRMFGANKSSVLIGNVSNAGCHRNFDAVATHAEAAPNCATDG